MQTYEELQELRFILQGQISALEKMIQAVREENAALRARVSELETRLMNMVGAAFQDHQDQRNSWKLDHEMALQERLAAVGKVEPLSEKPSVIADDEKLIDRILSGDGD